MGRPIAHPKGSQQDRGSSIPALCSGGRDRCLRVWVPEQGRFPLLCPWARAGFPRAHCPPPPPLKAIPCFLGGTGVLPGRQGRSEMALERAARVGGGLSLRPGFWGVPSRGLAGPRVPPCEGSRGLGGPVPGSSCHIAITRLRQEGSSAAWGVLSGRLKRQVSPPVPRPGC